MQKSKPTTISKTSKTYSRILIASSVATLIVATPVMAQEKPTFYGAIKTSINQVDNGDESSLNVSSNSTRVGIKGGLDIENKFDIFYQLEVEYDNTEEGEFTGGRNSFIGIKDDFGKIAIGQHDTPVKKIRSNGAVLFSDTIADSRAILSARADEDGTSLDERAKNAIFYKSPQIAEAIEVFVLYSTDNEADYGGDPDRADNNDEDLFSASITYKKDGVYLAVGIEEQSVDGGDDVEITRIGASYKTGELQFGGVFEDADAGDGSPLSRSAFALNGRYNMSSETWVGVQIATADDFDNSSDTGASHISAGIYHKLASPTQVYAVLAMTDNDDNAQFGISQGGIQDRIIADAPGDEVTGISVGIEHKF